MHRKRDLFKTTLDELNTQITFAKSLGINGKDAEMKMRNIEKRLKAIPEDLNSIDAIISEFNVKLKDDKVYLETVSGKLQNYKKMEGSKVWCCLRRGCCISRK